MRPVEMSIKTFREQAKQRITSHRRNLRKAGQLDASMGTEEYACLVHRLAQIYAEIHKALGGRVSDEMRAEIAQREEEKRKRREEQYIIKTPE